MVRKLILLAPFLLSTEAQAQATRLQRLEAYTRTIPSDRLNITIWASSFDLDDPYSESTGCVAAWSTLIFADEGFQLKRLSPTEPITVVYKHLRGMRACEAFFGISHREAERIFSYRNTPIRAADSIAAVISRHELNIDRTFTVNK